MHVRVASLCLLQKSANDHYRRNLRRRFCAKPRGPDASNVPPRRHRFRAFGQRGGRRRFDRARLAAATTDLHFPKQFVDEVHRWAEANYDKLGQLAQEAHQDPRANMESPILELAMTAFQAGGAPKKGDHG